MIEVNLLPGAKNDQFPFKLIRLLNQRLAHLLIFIPQINRVNLYDRVILLKMKPIRIRPGWIDRIHQDVFQFPILHKGRGCHS